MGREAALLGWLLAAAALCGCGASDNSDDKRGAAVPDAGSPGDAGQDGLADDEQDLGADVGGVDAADSGGGCAEPVEECNGLDDDLDGLTDEGFDEDDDGWTVCAGDCDDGQADVHPGATEVPCNGLDDDCDPTTPDGEDADGDGVSACGGGLRRP